MNIRAELAIIKKEMIEHKGALFIAPAILVALFFVLVTLQTTILGVEPAGIPVSSHETFIMAYVLAALFFVAYTLIVLFFYYADSFSADRKNNGLLFWKSLPISDLKILGLKLFTGTFIVPLIMLGWIAVAAIAAYIIGVLNMGEFSDFIAPWTALNTLIQISVQFAVVLILAMIWVVPYYAWVGVLSVFFKKWSIALAFIIPVVLIIIEQIFNFDGFGTSYIYDYLIETRLTEMVDTAAMSHDETFLSSVNKFEFEWGKSHNVSADVFLKSLPTAVWEFVTNIRWVAMSIGVLVAAVFVFVGSEYRRRFIQG
ncbi:MAG: hypothetical protein OCD03_03560 [Hyphomicrobiales bacterium]